MIRIDFRLLSVLTLMVMLQTTPTLYAQSTRFSVKADAGFSVPLKAYYGYDKNFTDFQLGTITGIDVGYSFTSTIDAKAEFSYSRNNAPSFGGDQFNSIGEWWIFLVGLGYNFPLAQNSVLSLQAKIGPHNFARLRQFIGTTGKISLGFDYFIIEWLSCNVESNVLYHFVVKPTSYVSTKYYSPVSEGYKDEWFCSFTVGLKVHW